MLKPTHSRTNSTGSSRHSRQNSRDWEVMPDVPPDNHKPDQTPEMPGICEGFLLKKRKYPLQGWHKRYFHLEKGILKYSKTPQDIFKGKIHGSLEVSLAVMSINKKSRRIDLDAGDNIFHMKTKNHEMFYIWVTKLSAHRVYKKNEAMNHHQGVLQALSSGTNSLPAVASFAQRSMNMPSMVSRRNGLSRGRMDAFHGTPTPSLARHHNRQVSVTESVAEYYDASEVLATESSSENEASDESGLSDITTTSVSSAHDVPNNVPKDTARRRTLPAHCADNSHIGILSILYNNIGKDLSRVSMPVALNEPLCFLQRLSEELEYSHLLDIANRIDDPYERMVYMAAFSISGYAWASWRNRYKPFNPVLGETYESIRNDRGFRFVSEQVSHHPPLSACHAESENFTFWQDQRWKNKFWGKSVEIVSSGMVNVTLPRYGDHYEWNKAVTCIHNVFSQQRWLEHYGDVIIRNTKSDVCTCKMTFVKSRYWGSDTSKNEVQGVVLNATGEVVHRFGGSWHEGIFCDTLSTPQCLWKPNGQPEDHFLYYGFSDYARELNELTPELQAILPPTDTRFRPDQRLLEEGKVDESDRRKDEVEEKQRDRRKELAKKGEEHVPRFFYKSLDEAGREVWAYNGAYWKTRENPGFANTKNLDLW
uniref:Oxysterol-binding protein n=1 Tax=Denticeps clupeoides TaxID=299321 RepID=A0AAY4CW37_9TELE